MAIYVNQGHRPSDGDRPWKHLDGNCPDLLRRERKGFPIKRIRNMDDNKPIGQHMDLRFWPWDSVTGMTIENVEYAGGVHRVLVVKFRDQFEEILLGLGNASVDEIRVAAKQLGRFMPPHTCRPR